MNKRTIVWDNPARDSFQASIRYIRQESPKNADKVKKKILERIDQLIARPERHNQDKYKLNNDGTYRAFELYRFRISYSIKEKEIHIVRVRSTDQEPMNY